MSIVIAGAGPAGLISALFFARRGHTVHVFDKRPDPVQENKEKRFHSDNERAWNVFLQEKGVQALAKAGVSLEAATAPGTGIQRVAAFQICGGKSLGGQQRGLRYTCLSGLRTAFQGLLERAAAEQGLEGLHFHWGAQVVGADLAGRRLLVAAAEGGGGSEEVPYDLLVAADGCASTTGLWHPKAVQVRQAAEQQVPGFQVSVEPSSGRRKTFTVQPNSAVSVRTPEGGAVLWSIASVSYGSAPTQGRILLSPSPLGDGVAGVLTMEGAGWEGLEVPVDYEALLRREYPGLPAEWVPEIAAQLAAKPIWPTGQRVSSSSLHGPSLVLIGDAGHAVTPRLGQGMNAALEDAWLLDQILEQTGGDLSSLPERFNAARLPDARALLWLDGQWQRRHGRGAGGRLNPFFFTTMAGLLCRMLGRRLTRGWVAPPPTLGMSSGTLSYSEARQLLVRDDSLCGAVVAAALAAIVSTLLQS